MKLFKDWAKDSNLLTAETMEEAYQRCSTALQQMNVVLSLSNHRNYTRHELITALLEWHSFLSLAQGLRIPSDILLKFRAAIDSIITVGERSSEWEDTSLVAFACIRMAAELYIASATSAVVNRLGVESAKMNEYIDAQRIFSRARRIAQA